MADYLPGPDADYQAWVANFVTYANANLIGLGLVAADMTPVTSAQTGFNTAFSAHITAKQAAQAAKQTKDEGRTGLTAAIRPLVRRLQASTVVSDAGRAALGINVPSGGGPIGPPTTAPVCTVECEPPATSRASSTRPRPPVCRPSAMGVEIWNKIGTRPGGRGRTRLSPPIPAPPVNHLSGTAARTLLLVRWSRLPANAARGARGRHHRGVVWRRSRGCGRKHVRRTKRRSLTPRAGAFSLRPAVNPPRPRPGRTGRRFAAARVRRRRPGVVG